MIIKYVNLELKKLASWLKLNKLEVNTGKTKVMVFYPSGKSIPITIFVFNDNDLNVPESPDLIFTIERIANQSNIPAYKILGVCVDKNLTFDFHFKCLHTKLSKSLHSVNRA